MPTLKSLEFEIEEARRRRDRLKQDVSNLKTRIKYHSKRGRYKLVEDLKRELRVVMEEYEDAKKMFNTLCEKWRRLREAN